MRKAAIGMLVFAASAAAQFSYVTPQSVNPVTALNAVTAIGASNPFIDIGQTVHFVNYTFAGGNPTVIELQIEASADCVTYFGISDLGTNVKGGTITALGWWPCIRVNLTKQAGLGAGVTMTATYTGSSTAPGILSGPLNTSGTLHRTLATADNANAVSTTYVVNMPQSASMVMVFSYSNTGCSGSSLTVQAAASINPNVGVYPPFTYTPTSTVPLTQLFIVPNFVGMSANLSYARGSGCAGITYSLDIYFTAAELIAPAPVGPAPVPPPAFANFVWNYSTAQWEPYLVPTVWKPQTSVALTGGSDTTIWTPAVGKKFRLMGYRLISTTNTTCNFKDNTGGTVFWRWISTGQPGVPDVMPINGFLSSTANNVLAINCNNTATLDGVLYGVEQ